MAERCVKGDYIGFTFGGVHSSELGLVRVSNGSRYEQDLLPPLQDKTAQVSGRDGVVYFNSQYNTRPIKVPVAFDNMTEESFQKLKELIMDKKPKYLWFDETPYKQWLVKAGGLQSFKWVCFDESKNIERLNDGDSEGTKKRIYKGEGTLEFVCFTPYAESRVTFLDEPVDYVWDWNRIESPKKLVRYSKNDKNYLNRKKEELNKDLFNLTLECNYNFIEWSKDSYLQPILSYWENVPYNDWTLMPEGNVTIVYNCGNINSNLKLIWQSGTKNTTYPGDIIYLLSQEEWFMFKEESKTYIHIKPFTLIGEDTGFIIDSKLKTIKGIDSYGNITGNIYEKHHQRGDFFKLPSDRILSYKGDNYVDSYLISKQLLTYDIDYKHYYI